ncbi:hypothetical protein [Vogesella indigofera]|uniref:Uncharacterized protein n=1 Tax=Vogesella indigofera TaxID=45465 RepID=A0ABT5I1S8_VOGIN|nr:hypothetical protein [Vogesella indigofera]MDC7689983.1 hypothetical protein [Vogesella indigofera]
MNESASYFGKTIQTNSNCPWQSGNRKIVKDCCVKPILYDRAVEILSSMEPKYGARKERGAGEWYAIDMLNAAIRTNMILIVD